MPVAVEAGAFAEGGERAGDGVPDSGERAARRGLRRGPRSLIARRRASKTKDGEAAGAAGTEDGAAATQPRSQAPTYGAHAAYDVPADHPVGGEGDAWAGQAADADGNVVVADAREGAGRARRGNTPRPPRRRRDAATDSVTTVQAGADAESPSSEFSESFPSSGSNDDTTLISA